MTPAIAALIIALLVVNLIGLLVIGARVGRQSGEARDLDRRLTTVEAHIKNLPTHEDLRKIREDVAATASGIASVRGQTQTMTDLLKTIQSHLLEQERHRR